MVASALAFGVMTALVKHLGARLPSQEIVLIRAIITLVLSLVIARTLLKHRGVNAWGVNRPLLLLRGLLGFLALSCVYYAVTKLPLAEATVLQYMHPVLTSLFAAVFLREVLRTSTLVSCAVSMLGVVLVTRPDALFGAHGADLDVVAVLIALGGAVCSSLAYVVIRRLSATEDPNVIVLYFPIVAVPLSIPVILTDLVVPRPSDWPLLLGVGISAQLGQIWLTRGLARETAGRATAISYTQVLFAALLGIAFFDELPTGWTLVGGLLILAATLLVALRPRTKPATPAELGIE